MTELEEWNKEPDATELQRVAQIEDFSERESGYKNLIDRGSILSMVNLGFAYEYRPKELGGPDFELCKYWYNAAIAAGSAAATYEFGRFYWRQKDYVKARAVLEIGFERECAPSIVRLASIYIHGLGTAKDYERATALLKYSTDLGNLWAKQALANMYINLGTNIFIKIKGYFLKFYSAAEFKIEKKRYAESERLKR